MSRGPAPGVCLDPHKYRAYYYEIGQINPLPRDQREATHGHINGQILATFRRLHGGPLDRTTIIETLSEYFRVPVRRVNRVLRRGR